MTIQIDKMPASDIDTGDSEEPSPRSTYTSPASSQPSVNGSKDHGVLAWLRSAMKGKSDSTLRETLEEYIDTDEEDHSEAGPSISTHEKALISNVLKLRDTTVVDVMIPRADVVGIDIDISQEELFKLLSERQFSRLPVYHGTLDDVVGTIHIKDVLSMVAQQRPIVIHDLLREVPIVSPSLHVLDLLLQMRQSRKHMAMVVDEYGGIDGLVTIGDVLESIIGQIEDEHDPDQHVDLSVNNDGTILADARVDLEDFEEKFGCVLADEERDDYDTLGGLVFSIAGRIPVRGEVLTHDSGMVFEVLDADPRRIKRLKISNVPENVPG